MKLVQAAVAAFAVGMLRMSTWEAKLLAAKQAMLMCSNNSLVLANALTFADPTLHVGLHLFSPSYSPLGPSASIRDVKEALNRGPGPGRAMSRPLWEGSLQPM